MTTVFNIPEDFEEACALLYAQGEVPARIIVCDEPLDDFDRFRAVLDFHAGEIDADDSAWLVPPKLAVELANASMTTLKETRFFMSSWAPSGSPHADFLICDSKLGDFAVAPAGASPPNMLLH